MPFLSTCSWLRSSPTSGAASWSVETGLFVIEVAINEFPPRSTSSQRVLIVPRLTSGLVWHRRKVLAMSRATPHWFEISHGSQTAKSPVEIWGHHPPHLRVIARLTLTLNAVERGVPSPASVDTSRWSHIAFNLGACQGASYGGPYSRLLISQGPGRRQARVTRRHQRSSQAACLSPQPLPFTTSIPDSQSNVNPLHSKLRIFACSAISFSS